MRSANVLGGLLTGVFVSLLAMLLYNPPVIAALVIVAVASLGTVFVLKNQERNIQEYEKRKHILTSPPPGGRWYTPEPAQFFGLPPDMPEKQKKGIRRTGFRDPTE